MTALYIILAIIFVIWLILFQFVTVDFSFIDKKLKVKIKYLFFTVFDMDKISKDDDENLPEKDDSSEKNKKSEQKHIVGKKDNTEKKLKAKKDTDSDKKPKENDAVKGENKKAKKAKKKTLEDRLFDIGDKIDFIRELYEIGKKPVFNILKGIHLTKLFIDFDIADEDAYDCAIKFGRMNALVFNAIGSLACLFTVKKKSIDIHCVYDKAPPKYDASFYLRLRPTTVIASAFSFGTKYLAHFIIKPKLKSLKNRKKKNKSKNKSAAAKTA